MQNNIPSPNPAIRAILLSSEMKTLMRTKGEQAQAIYRSIVARRTGRLGQSAEVQILLGGRRQDRWTARMIVTAPYAASHEFGIDDGNARVYAGARDLNTVLNALRTT